MRPTIHCRWKFLSELRRESRPEAVALSSSDVTACVVDLVEESFVNGVLAGALPELPDRIEARIDPVLAGEVLVERIRVQIQGSLNGSVAEFVAEFSSGRWGRTRHKRLQQLREEGTLGADEAVLHALMALPTKECMELETPVLQPPPILDGTLEQFGFRGFCSDGELTPDRPILVNQRLEADSITAAVAAGAKETGAAVLGATIRLPKPLPDTSTRIVTLLTACITDTRHSGRIHEWSISPEALIESSRIADLRGLGESVITVIHSHGWSSECGRCNENADCPLAECTHVSLLDYQVLESLFPGKATLMPIVGRRLGAAGKRPILAIHAWRGGEMRPMRFRHYSD